MGLFVSKWDFLSRTEPLCLKMSLFVSKWAFLCKMKQIVSNKPNCLKIRQIVSSLDCFSCMLSCILTIHCTALAVIWFLYSQNLFHSLLNNYALYNVVHVSLEEQAAIRRWQMKKNPRKSPRKNLNYFILSMMCHLGIHLYFWDFKWDLILRVYNYAYGI